MPHPIILGPRYQTVGIDFYMPPMVVTGQTRFGLHHPQYNTLGV